MKKSAVFAALIVAVGIGVYAAARYIDLVGLFKRLHGIT
ncbi:YdgA family protein [Duganella vulcania]|nr:YdgA family protein [Duganella vulcania]